MKTVLVTGGAGFIGSCFVRQSVGTEQLRILNLDKLTYAGNLDSIPSESHAHTFVKGDISDAELVADLLQQYRPAAIIHFAAESHVDRSIDGPRAFVETNVRGTFELLFAALRYWECLPPANQQSFRFLHVSTDEVYGSLGTSGKFAETSAYRPNSPYSASKAAADHFVRAFFETYGLPTIVTNCSNNYGPFQFPEKLVPLTILNAVEGKPLPVYGDGQNVRDWLYVEDHCEALRVILRSGSAGETYNIGGNNEQSNLNVVKAICALVDELVPDLPHVPCASLVHFVSDRPGHDRRYAVDTRKISSELHWAPQQSFQSGLRKTVSWYLANRSWVERIKSGDYRQRRGLSRSAGDG